jgi:hypothetical protein
MFYTYPVFLKFTVLYIVRYIQGLLSSFFWEQGFDKICESFKSLELFEQFDVHYIEDFAGFTWSYSYVHILNIT